MLKKILIVEDEQSISDALNIKLKSVGYDTIQSFDGKDGLKKAIQEKPDLILLDIIMPVMDGMTMLEKLREDAWGKDAAVIILTNLSDAKKVEEAASKNVYDFLVKADWKLVDVLDVVENYMKKEK